MPPLIKLFALTADQGNLCHYFPGWVSEPPSNTSMMLYAGHTITFLNLATGLVEWLTTRNAT